MGKQKTLLSQKKTRFENCAQFYSRFKNELRQLTAFIEQIQPDIIIALSRKAPRLLELLQEMGHISTNTIIITEKAIDFLSKEYFYKKRVLIFDDIVISGSTISNIVDTLHRHFSADIVVLSFAIDEETIALSKIENNYYIISKSGKKFLLNYIIPLTRDDRFTSCHELVRSFSFLNKPYDIDFPIFYGEINQPINTLVNREHESCYNLTTIYHQQNNFSRYTIQSNSKQVNRSTVSSIFGAVEVIPQICKMRAYLDGENGKISLVPMLTLGINYDYLMNNKVFKGEFSYLNDVIDLIKWSGLDRSNIKSMYRLVAYISSYVYGESFLTRNYDQWRKEALSYPSRLLNHQDLSYLFGPSISTLLLDFLDENYIRVKTLSNRILSPIFAGSAKEQGSQSVNNDNPMDEDREKLYDIISDPIKNQIKINDCLTNQIASIFESLYYKVELPSQINALNFGLKGNESKRLSLGFNYDQLKEILIRHGVFSGKDDEEDMRLSLSIDFLVDEGIMIPIYYYNRKDGIYERCYRYGEDALSAKRYGYLIAMATNGLFEYIRDKFGSEKVPRLWVLYFNMK